MWWLVGLLAAIAASSGEKRETITTTPRRPEGTSAEVIYRSLDGSTSFRFRFSPLGSGIRIYIVEFPNPLVGSCHVLHDSAGRYICWTNPIRSIPEAERIAQMWSEATLQFQREGRIF